MTDTREATALALLRSGRSYAEAAESSGLPVEQCMKLLPMRSDTAAQADHAGLVYRHKKRGSEYVLSGIGKMQAERWLDDASETNWRASVDMREVAVYRSVDDGSLWVRPREEFEDGRFEAIAARCRAAPSPAPQPAPALIEELETALKEIADEARRSAAYWNGPQQPSFLQIANMAVTALASAKAFKEGT